ncbi:MAG: ABC transporter ATP-binding protein, partial [Sandaracinaceae bacterium]|nr:ABC transporter ATP-binding protein [Sandaracinaceae bacterium]
MPISKLQTNSSAPASSPNPPKKVDPWLPNIAEARVAEYAKIRFALSQLWSFFGPKERFALFLASLLILGSASLTLVVAKELAIFVERSIRNQSTGKQLWLLSSLALLRSIALALGQLLSIRIGLHLARGLRQMLSEALFKTPYSSETHGPDALALFGSDVAMLQQAFGQRLPSLLSEAITLTFGLAYAFWLAPALCLYASWPIALALPLWIRLQRRVFLSALESRRAYAKMLGNFEESLRALPVFQSACAIDFALKRLESRVFDFEKAAFRVRKSRLFAEPLFGIFGLASFIALAWALTEALQSHVMGSEKAARLLGALTISARSLSRILGLTQEWGETLASLKRVASWFSLHFGAHSPSKDPSPCLHSSGGLECIDLFVERGGKAVLQGLFLSIKRGESVGIEGPNGAGKSTLALAISGLLPYRGSICFEGKPAHLFCALVPQEPHLFEGSLASNVALSEGHDKEKVEKALLLFFSKEWLKERG